MQIEIQRNNVKMFFYVQKWFDQLLKLYLESDIGSGIKLWYENHS